ncbi:autotransporter-associated beta strand repeat-containing protein, partial [Rhodanobacter sp. MP1X3]|uniref:beta strand repeat-containing protein n=1 Tax=Rhodanobacter sp. MP1X3 TaxID=2723086 RepID=UPI00160B4943
MKHVIGGGHDGRWLREKSGQGEPTRKRLVVMLGIALAATSVDAFAQVTAPSAGGDITALLQADAGTDNIVLQGAAYSVALPSGTTTYSGVLSGTGTLTVSGAGNTLVLTGVNTFNVPSATETIVDKGYYPGNAETYEGIAGNSFHGWIYDVVNMNAPAINIGTGATLKLAANAQTGNTGSLGSFGNNFVNIQNDGTLAVDGANDGSTVTINSISGSGSLHLVSGELYLPTVSTYTGATIIENNQTLYLGTDHSYGAIPDSSFVFNNGSFILNTPIDAGSGNSGVMTVTQNVWESHFGNDININGYGGLIVLSGVYSYTDSGVTAETDPSLSNPSLNYTMIRGGSSTRGFNIEGGIVQFGDGTTDKIFLPGNEYTSYINLHNGGILAFDYDGTVTLDTPIGGGIYHDSTSTPGIGSVVITGNASNANHVIFTQPGDYNGLTQIDAGTILQLGDGTVGNSTGTPGQLGYFSSSRGDSSLLTAESSDGLSTDRITDNGTLLVDNVVGAQDGITAVSLSNISGSGGLTQIGVLPLTLLENTTYTGATTIGAGSTLYLGTNSSGVAGSLASSSSVALTGAGATLDISQATAETLQDLSGAAGSIVALGSHALTVGTVDSTMFAGAITDGGIAGGTAGSLIKIGIGTLALSGANTYTGGTTISGGTLQLGVGSSGGSVLGDIVDQGIVAFDRSDNNTFSGVISGSGGLLQTGSGTTALTAVDTYTGTTEVASGDLQVDGTITSDVQVDAGATLSGTGQVGGINVFGNLLIGDAAAAAKVMSATRTVTFNPGSQFQIYIDPTGAHGLLQINGSAVLKGGNVSLSAAAGTYTANQSYQILAATGGVTGTFSGVLVNSLNLTPTLKYQANGVYLVLEAANAGSTGSSGSGTTSSGSGTTSSGSGTASSGSGTVTVPTGTASLTPLFPCSQLTL